MTKKLYQKKTNLKTNANLKATLNTRTILKTSFEDTTDLQISFKFFWLPSSTQLTLTIDIF